MRALPLLGDNETNRTRNNDMRLLFTGLGFFATALVLAILPVVAHGGPVNPDQPCTITGTDNGELLIGTPGRDVICGLGGSDVITAKAGDDIVKGGDGADEIYGDWGSDALYGGRGNDRIWARDSQHDHVNCGAGSKDFTRVDLSRDKRVYCESVRH